MPIRTAAQRLPPGSQTLVKYLVSAGVGARRQCADLIMSGRVRVNGLPINDLNHPVRVRDRVDVNGEPARAQTAENVYLLLNKPAGYLSTVNDDRGRKTVLDLVPEEARVNGLVPAGRLDLDSTGLMLLTNDGSLVDVVTHPRYGVEKEYRVRIDRPLSPDRIRALLDGIPMEEGMARAKAVRRLAEENGEFLYSLTLVEGKKREVRRMMLAMERRVIHLERTRMGNIVIGDLPSGKTRSMTSAELRGLLAVARHHPQSMAPGARAYDDYEEERPSRPAPRSENRPRPDGQRDRSGRGEGPPTRRPMPPRRPREQTGGDTRPGGPPRNEERPSPSRQRNTHSTPSRQSHDLPSRRTAEPEAAPAQQSSPVEGQPEPRQRSRRGSQPAPTRPYRSGPSPIKAGQSPRKRTAEPARPSTGGPARRSGAPKGPSSSPPSRRPAPKRGPGGPSSGPRSSAPKAGPSLGAAPRSPRPRKPAQ